MAARRSEGEYVGPWVDATLLGRYGAEVTWGVMFACGVAGVAWLILTRDGPPPCALARW
jgi:hypothetical protein